MGVVVISIGVFGPRTNHRSLEEISQAPVQARSAA
jgi:putative MFS transporter